LELKPFFLLLLGWEDDAGGRPTLEELAWVDEEEGSFPVPP
jgi:hypothetical protein